MDGDSVLDTDMACTREEDDSTVGLEYDGRRSGSGNGGRSSAVPRYGIRFSLIISGPCKSRIFANPTARSPYTFLHAYNQALKPGRPYSLDERNAQCWRKKMDYLPLYDLHIAETKNPS